MQKFWAFVRKMNSSVWKGNVLHRDILDMKLWEVWKVPQKTQKNFGAQHKVNIGKQQIGYDRIFEVVFTSCWQISNILRVPNFYMERLFWTQSIVHFWRCLLRNSFVTLSCKIANLKNHDWLINCPIFRHLQVLVSFRLFEQSFDRHLV